LFEAAGRLILETAREPTMARSRGRGIEFLDVLPEDGERRLMLAVLIDAIQSYTRHRTRVSPLSGYHEWRRERAWFQADEPSNPFSFSSICAALGLNSDYVRRRVLGACGTQRPVKVRRYTAKVEQSWLRQRRAPRRASSNERAPGVELHACGSPSLDIGTVAQLGVAISDRL